MEILLDLVIWFLLYGAIGAIGATIYFCVIAYKIFKEEY